MSSLLRYQLINYLRTYHYVPPFTIFILCLIVNYTFVPNPILDSYSFTSLLLFFLMGWFTVTLFHAEDEGQKMITTLHTKKTIDYNLGIFIICGLLAFSLSCVSVIYPILIEAFFEKPKLLHILLGFLSHFSLSLLAIALTALFTRELVKNRRNTWWGCNRHPYYFCRYRYFKGFYSNWTTLVTSTSSFFIRNDECWRSN